MQEPFDNESETVRALTEEEVEDIVHHALLTLNGVEIMCQRSNAALSYAFQTFYS